MKKVLLGAAALIAFVAPGVAAAQTSGNVTLGYATLDDDDDSNKDGVLSLDGSVVTDLSGAWNIQFDGRYSTMDHGGHDDAFSSATAHVFHRDGAFAFGGFAGLDNNGGSSLYHLGVEGQIYLPSITLSGAYTYSDQRNGTSFSGNAIDVTGDFFLTPNTSIGGLVAWIDDEWAGQDGLTYGINVEHQFAGSPFSIGASYTTAEFDYNGGGGHDVDSFGIFGRFNFGTGSLQERSQSGASMIGGSARNRGNILTW